MFLLTFCALHISAADYTGNGIVAVLGKNVNSTEFSQFRSFWGLNSKHEGFNKGIRLLINPSTQNVDTILISGYGYKANGVAYTPCEIKLPFDIKLNDNFSAVAQKTGTPGNKVSNTYRYDINSCSFLLNYNTDGKIQWIKVFVNKNRNPVAIPPEKVRIKSGELAGGGYSVKNSSFKRAIMGVFESWRSSYLSSVKQSQRNSNNFWNYKYTYATSLKIPGEQYNMLYSFPFEHSQLDFVSVLKESDKYDESFAVTYKEFEKKLMENFSAKEGWKASCLPNTDGSKLSDFEVRNDKYGSIILDYCKNPKGKHVLYLRFLLYS